MEGLMAGNSALEIRYLNPLMIFHSLYSSWDYDHWLLAGDGDFNGSLFSLELNWNIVKALAVYGQFVMTEYSTPYEMKGWPAIQPPNGLGYLFGIEYVHSFNVWRSLFFGEFIYTDPYLYMNSSPFSSFIWMRRLSLDPSRVRYNYTGYPRDTIAGTIGARFFKGDILNVSGEFSFLSQGEHTIAWDWGRGSPYNQEKTPSGIAENKFIASLGVEWKPFLFLVIGGSITGIVSLNNNHLRNADSYGGQAAFFISFLL
jgi:hypothetical protein